VGFWPWRRELAAEVVLRPKEGEGYALLAPAEGRVREAQALKGKVLKGKVLAAGDPAFTYVPQVEVAGSIGRYTPAYSYNANPGAEEERRIRERYSRQITEAYGYIASDQQQVSRAWSEQVRAPRGGVSYEVQLAQNALARAQQLPGELSRKMEQELSAARAQRDAYARVNQLAQSQIATRPVAQGVGDLAVPVHDRVWVQSSSLQAGMLIHPGQPCAVLIPDGANFEFLAAVPAALVRDIRPGLGAMLEVEGWLRDAELIPLLLVKLGNRNLEPEEAAGLLPGGAGAGPYVLAVFRLADPEGRLFPPPEHCRMHMAGLRRCLVQRLLP